MSTGEWAFVALCTAGVVAAAMAAAAVLGACWARQERRDGKR